jgi:hypothetical protein
MPAEGILAYLGCLLGDGTRHDPLTANRTYTICPVRRKGLIRAMKMKKPIEVDPSMM